MTGGVQSEVAVALRIARVNHACQPNAGTSYDEIARVAILFAQRDIRPGEEITVCYYASFFGLVPVEQEINMNILKRSCITLKKCVRSIWHQLFKRLLLQRPSTSHSGSQRRRKEDVYGRLDFSPSK